MKLVSTIAAIIVCASLCSSCGPGSAGARNNAQLTEAEKHRLYSAALAASDTPLDSDLFKNVCRTIDIFDAAGKPNQKYLIFVSDHVNWSLMPENQEFRRQIDTTEKAREYINQQLPR